MTSHGKCPRCSKTLQPGAAGQVTARACGRCGGLWLDQELASRFGRALVDQGKLELSESARIIGESVAKRASAGSLDTSPGDLPCVVCGAAMRREHLERAGFDLDICDGHGTFFDRGELQSVAHLLGAKAPAALDDGNNYLGGSFNRDDGSTGGAIALGILGVILDIVTS